MGNEMKENTEIIFFTSTEKMKVSIHKNSHLLKYGIFKELDPEKKVPFDFKTL